ncbi:MAG: DNA polymerase III subunit beta [Candidatus Ratteibacteria bacterium]|nr:DNA polymerase III subunit beta [Candidatus Ratteibacteria bacterium]
MKVKVEKESILKGIQTVQNAVSPKSTLPILSNLLLDTQKNRLNLFCTDLELGINTTISAEVIRPGSISIPVKKTGDIIKELPDKEISLEVIKNQIEIKCSKSFFKIFGLPKEEFPKIPIFKEDKEISLSQNTLKTIIKKTNFSVSYNETRYVLNGLYFKIDKGILNVVGTDGRRLSCVSVKLKETKGVSFSFIIPIKAIQELSQILQDEKSEVVLKVGENQVSCKIPSSLGLGEINLTSRLIEGTYPNYEQVIPKEIEKRIKIKREEFLTATRRAAILTSEKANSVKFSFTPQGKLIISANTPEVGESKEEMDTVYKGEELNIAFNPHFLIDVLKNIESEEINIGLSNSLSPGVIQPADKNENYICVIMPMRLN